MPSLASQLKLCAFRKVTAGAGSALCGDVGGGWTCGYFTVLWRLPVVTHFLVFLALLPKGSHRCPMHTEVRNTSLVFAQGPSNEPFRTAWVAILVASNFDAILLSVVVDALRSVVLR